MDWRTAATEVGIGTQRSIQTLSQNLHANTIIEHIWTPIGNGTMLGLVNT
jgi:hypothetical protein